MISLIKKIISFFKHSKKNRISLNYDSDAKLKKSIINILDKVKNREEKFN